nr:hypothetical protein [Acetobacter persici]
MSFLKQGGRTSDWHPAKMLTYFGELLGGQVGLASPGVFLFFWGASGCCGGKKTASPVCCS